MLRPARAAGLLVLVAVRAVLRSDAGQHPARTIRKGAFSDLELVRRLVDLRQQLVVVGHRIPGRRQRRLVQRQRQVRRDGEVLRAANTLGDFSTNRRLSRSQESLHQLPVPTDRDAAQPFIP